MNFEVALYHVHEKLLSWIALDEPLVPRNQRSISLHQDNNNESFVNRLKIKHMFYAIEVLWLIGICLLLGIFLIFHLNFVNNSGCLSELMDKFEHDHNVTFKDTSHTLLRFTYNPPSLFKEEPMIDLMKNHIGSV